jgi:hypothetical protein
MTTEERAPEGHKSGAIRVYRMDDNEWWAGESLAACVAEGRRQRAKAIDDAIIASLGGVVLNGSEATQQEKP